MSARTCVMDGCREPVTSYVRRGSDVVVWHTVCREHWRRKTAIAHPIRPIGSVRTLASGYATIATERGVMPEHRYVMEQTLGRVLRKGETVHHLNGVRNDNRPENLELWVLGHPAGQRAAEVTCPHCGKPWDVG